MTAQSDCAAYRRLCECLREISFVAGASKMLGWDQETYMPPRALGFRADQLAFLCGWTHRRFTAPEVGDWLSACEDHAFPDGSVEAANVREWRRKYRRQTRLSAELVEEYERACTLARDAWVEARRRSRFPLFQPHLEKLLELSRRMADAWGYDQSPYDALLDGYEVGAKTEDLRSLFAALQSEIGGILGAAVERCRRVPKDFLLGDYPVADQMAFNREVATTIGFDFDSGRIDTTTHPFCTDLGPNDCRMTTRYDERDFTNSLYSILHEAGHGLYNQGLPAEHFGTPAGSAASLGIHESQSRLWENHIGRTLPFWQHWHPIACRYFSGLRGRSPEQICAAVNRVTPSFIRVDADQVSYDLHILVRFEIEVRLIEKDLAAKDVPAAWNEAFERALGLKVPDDAHGCLQDIHWSLGSFGYFPTYTLGNLNAAQLFHRACADVPGLAADLAAGRYGELLGWLRRHVHAKGQQLPPQELMRAATGESTQSRYHFEYLRQRLLG